MDLLKVLRSFQFYRYSKPLLISKKCLLCHGKKTMLPKSIKEILAKKYPNDKAVDFKIGDIRGMISIKFF